MRKGSRHEDLKGDTVALAKLVMKEGEKPGKFLLPHGIILLGWWLRIFMEDNLYGIQNQSSFRIMELSDGEDDQKSHGPRDFSPRPDRQKAAMGWRVLVERFFHQHGRASRECSSHSAICSAARQ